jgi:LysM repeat protein
VAEKSSSAKAPEATGQFWDYVVRPNDTLQKIVIGYNRAPEMRGLAKLTVADVLKANPGLNQDKLYVGKKLLIPVPPKKEGKPAKER